MLTKTQIKIMEVFTAEITKRFSLTDISKILNLQYKVIHRSINELINNKLILVDNKRFRLNYKENHQILAFIEFLRSKKLLNKPKNSTLSLFVKDTTAKIKSNQFIFLIFGSTINKIKSKDIDILMIINDNEKVEVMEKKLYNIANMFTKKFDIHVITHESVQEMFEKRDELNLMNEILNKHAIIYGAESFYRMLTKWRK
jgi:hypothetical protein